ncbi:cell division protein FtsX [Falsiroseomonas tokyonensis]|uniref:Cell division protein FtsX n=1 Tax=Falsiroseomonas tokyonensis TaxID=430521 RepID=A0ABV7C201_9PROT|nr:FtsX-like permease family protein [Falsiroseomonas tokyonensis]MBU8541098.1 cell division protein FtsX [Falsiroseomonas tokyonensis]
MARRRRYSRDPLGLRRALSGLLLPGLVAAMALLAALALAGAQGAAALAERWQRGAAAAVTVQIPDADATRLQRAVAALRAMPEVASAQAMEPERLTALLRPWLGDAPAISVPGVIELRLRNARTDPVLIGDRLADQVPGALVEAHGLWVQRLAALARSLQAIALGVLVLVAAVAAAVVAVGTRAGLAARRDAIEVLHGLGARDGDIAGRFARRLGVLAATGAVVGTVVAVPALALLADLAGPWVGADGRLDSLAGLPWAGLLTLPPVAFLVGWGTAQFTVRRWLRRLP